MQLVWINSLIAAPFFKGIALLPLFRHSFPPDDVYIFVKQARILQSTVGKIDPDKYQEGIGKPSPKRHPNQAIFGPFVALQGKYIR